MILQNSRLFKKIIKEARERDVRANIYYVRISLII